MNEITQIIPVVAGGRHRMPDDDAPRSDRFLAVRSRLSLWMRLSAAYPGVAMRRSLMARGGWVRA